MRAALLAALLAVVLVPSARAVWLGRLDPQQVAAPPHQRGPGATRVLGPLWSPGSPGAPRTTGAAGGRAGGGGTAPHLRPLPQLMGSWYVLAVASGEKDFALEKATKSVEGVEVMLTSQNTLKMRASRHRLERCHLQAVELRRQNSRWVFGNPCKDDGHDGPSGQRGDSSSPLTAIRLPSAPSGLGPSTRAASPGPCVRGQPLTTGRGSSTPAPGVLRRGLGGARGQSVPALQLWCLGRWARVGCPLPCGDLI
uniref:Uncharacterized protein n=1 Tax=Bos mutus grunniens TaxID=30521 RepID=A0A8C0A747_BOSMU